MANNYLNQTKLSQLAQKPAGDSNDQVVLFSPGWSNDVLIPLGNLYSNSLLLSANLQVVNEIIVGNSTVNVTINSTTTFSGSGGYAGGNLIPSINNGIIIGDSSNVYANLTLGGLITIGNSSVNATMNSTAFTGTANNATNFAGEPQSFYANVTSPSISSNISVGSNVYVNTSSVFFGNTTVNSTINSTVFTGTSNNATNLGGQSLSYFANSTSPIISISVNVGSNVGLSTLGLLVGNSTVNALVNSTVFTGTANNALNLAGIAAADYLTNSGNFTISGLYKFIANVSVNGNFIANGATGTAGQALTSGGSGQNVYWSTVSGGSGTPGGSTTQIQYNLSGAFAGDANLTWASETLTIGNSTVNTQINSTFSTGTSNNTSFVGSTSAANVVSNTQLTQNLANYALIAGQTFTGDVNVGSNVVISTTNLMIGNSTVNTTHTNSGLFTLGDVTSGNLTLNGSALFIGNSTVNAIVNSTVFTGIANNTSFVGSVSAANVVSNTQLSQNLALYALIAGQTFTGDVNVGSNVVISTSNILVGNSTVNTTHVNAGLYVLGGITSGNVTLNATSLFFGNSTINTLVNSTVFTGLAWTANNATNLGGVGAASYVTNSGNFTIGGVLAFIANISVNSQITANGGAGGAGQVLTSGGSGQNVYWSTVSGGGGGPFGATTQIAYNNAGSETGDANLTWTTGSTKLSVGVPGTTNAISVNATTVTLGNSTVNATVNSTVYTGTANDTLFVGTVSAANVVSNTQLTQNLALYALLTGASFTGDVNVGSNVVLTTTNLTVGNSTVNTTHVNAGLYVLGGITSGNVTVNSTLVYVGNSTSNVTVNSSVLSLGNSGTSATVNSTVYSGTANNTNFVGSVSAANVVSNSQLALNLASYALLAGAPFTGDVNVGSNVVISTTNMNIGNSTVNTTHVNAGLYVLGGITSGNVTLNATSLFFGNSTVNALANSTVFTGTANNATNLGGVASGSYALSSALSSYALLAGSAFTGVVNVVANLSVNGVFFANGSNGALGQVLTSAGTENVYWSTVSGGGGPYGSTTQIAFNLAGTESGDANLTWVQGSTLLTVGNSTVNNQINSISINFGNAIVNSTEFSIGNSTINVSVNSSQIQFGPNTLMNTGGFVTGNSTVNSQMIQLGGFRTQNSIVLATVNTTQISLGSNVVMTPNYIFVGNSTVNTEVTNSGLFTLGGIASGNLTVNGSALFIGNSTVNNSVNSTTIFFQPATANQNLLANAGQFGGVSFTQFNSPLLSYPQNFKGPYSVIDASLMSCGADGTGIYGFYQTMNANYWVKSNTYVISCVAKPANSNCVAITISSATNWWATAVFDTSLGTAGQTANGTSGGSVTSSSIAALQNGWYLCSMVATIANTNPANVVFSLAANAAAVNFSTNGIPILTTPAANAFSVYIDNPYAGDSGWTQVSNNFVNGGYSVWNTTVGNSTVNTISTVDITANAIEIAQYVGSNSFNHRLDPKRIYLYDSFGNTFYANSSLLTIGNSSVNSTINSTVFTGTANNTLFVGSTSAANVVSNTQLTQNLANYALLSGAVFTGVVNVTANLAVNGAIFANGSNGSSGQVLTSAGTGNAYWSTVSGGGGTPGGSTTQIQYNLSGAFAGDANLTWDSETLTIGNSTVNSFINSTMTQVGNSGLSAAATDSYLVVGNSTVNNFVNSSYIILQPNTSVNTQMNAFTWMIQSNATANLTVNSTVLNIQTNSTANMTFGASNILICGNLTVNSTFGNNGFSVQGLITSGNVNINGSALFLGNSTVNSTINSSSFTQTQAANGSCHLPGGMIMNWGWVAVNSSVGSITFTTAYGTNAYIVMISGNNTAAPPAITAWVKATATATSTSTAAASNCWFWAIGI